MKRHVVPVAALLLSALAGCSHRPPVQSYSVPPRIDLTQHELIGVVEFTSTSDGKLAPLATRRFTEWARRDQGVVRIVELGPSKRLLRSMGRDRWDPELYKTLGRDRGLKTILVGELKISDIKPDIKVMASLASGQVSAQVDATLEVQLIETATGASIWSSSAGASKSVGHVSMFSGKRFSFDADDPDRAYGDLVDVLVDRTTRDFRVSWETR